MTLEKAANYKRAAMAEITSARDKMRESFVAGSRMPTV
jgi:hypothetical protein